MSIKVTVDAIKTLENLGEGLAQYNKNLKLQVFKALTLLEAAIKQNIRRNSGLKVRTGRLLNSVKKEIKDEGEIITGEVGTEGVPYARIHEFGGTITAKGKALAIPLEENRNRDGSPKITIQELFGGLGSKVFVTKNGVVMLTSGGGKKMTKLTPMFVFKKSVDIPARPYVQPTLAAKQDQILKEFGLFLSACFKPKGD